MSFNEEVTKAMTLLGEDERTIFMGQQVEYSGSSMYNSLEGVPPEKKLELPIIEDTQLGMSIGMSLAGYIPICIYPRFDFLLLAINQLVNHLEKIKEMSQGEWSPKVIIRTMVGKKEPLNPGLQHCGDYHVALMHMLRSVEVLKIWHPDRIVATYRNALDTDGSILIIEAG